MASKINNKLYPTLYPNFEVLNNYNNIIMASKADFNLTIPEQTPLKTESKFFTACGAAVLTIADLEASLVAAGCVSPNDPANPPQITGITYATLAKNTPALDNLNGDAEVVATGEAMTVTDAKGDPFLLAGGNKDHIEVCVLDEDCDLVPDASIDDAFAFDVPADSCVKFAITYA